MVQKADLEKEKKAMIESAAEKDVTLKKKIATIGNIVHASVPVGDNEVRLPGHIMDLLRFLILNIG
jgi:seryl-tRNA synthetase